MQKQYFPPIFCTRKHIRSVKGCSQPTATKIYKQMEEHYQLEDYQVVTIDQACVHLNTTKRQYLEAIGEKIPPGYWDKLEKGE